MKIDGFLAVISPNGVAFDARLFSRSELQVLEQVANEFKTITAKAISEKLQKN
ncbi:MAG: hypothetical protein IBX55_23200 [Methyloprofundus sp.]|nr:hypothetical protein [Methyloprofundus sp.]